MLKAVGRICRLVGEQQPKIVAGEGVDLSYTWTRLASTDET